MKLIAETEDENTLLCGLAALLCDLGVDVDSYTREESIAIAFWNASDCISFPDRLANLSTMKRASFLRFFEDELRQAMLAAGYLAIERALEETEGEKSSHHCCICN